MCLLINEKQLFNYDIFIMFQNVFNTITIPRLHLYHYRFRSHSVKSFETTLKRALI